MVADPLDCKNSLVKNDNFSQPFDIDYDFNQMNIDAIPSYESFFKHSQKDDCHVTSCQLMANENDCMNAYKA